MKWQDDGQHKQHPPWIDTNPCVFCGGPGPFWWWKHQKDHSWFWSIIVFFKFSVNISTLRHLVGNEVSKLQGKTHELKNAASLYFISDLQFIVIKAFLTRLLVRLLAFCSTESPQAMLRSTVVCETLRWPRRWRSGPPRRSLRGWLPEWPLSPPCLSAGPGLAQQPGTKEKRRRHEERENSEKLRD